MSNARRLVTNDDGKAAVFTKVLPKSSLAIALHAVLKLMDRKVGSGGAMSLQL